MNRKGTDYNNVNSMCEKTPLEDLKGRGIEQTLEIIQYVCSGG